ncbi:hypothetical protein MKY96_11355 [Paenibacillus sp. FSL R7-0302]|uniref:hypothetical protein n=1 Tax=Paenibacillus sp. FSL R7-0302 TaxID=2921681 RepID=UPI0030FAC9F2
MTKWLIALSAIEFTETTVKTPSAVFRTTDFWISAQNPRFLKILVYKVQEIHFIGENSAHLLYKVQPKVKLSGSKQLKQPKCEHSVKEFSQYC